MAGDIGVSVVWLGAHEFDAALEANSLAMEAATPEAMRAAGEVLVAASAAHINSQSGTLAGSIQVLDVMPAGPETVARLGPTVIYGRRHQLGKRGRYHSPPFPFLDVGVAEGAPSFGDALAAEWARVF